MDTAVRERLIQPGERVCRTVRYSREDIARFAELTGDRNPLHTDSRAAERARFGEIIASGQQTAALMMGQLASHFSRDDDGVPREMLCLNFNFAFKHPVFADQDIELAWTVSAAQWHPKLGGMLGQLDGTAGVRHAPPSVVARGTILVKLAA
ncbi:MaoC family dehydratase [Aquabacterium sp. J223]|uniref:MaoC family dehydratase n=1 Tax=Aquabacterium sp. J223 TaxID=2898431 RepID=UPI0021ADC52C|nr:MaoC family dehydratase [Aquabacterium sp. J223]UUX95836.1 MaoC family dehydratase [Aquabacterium sp. J223]